MKRYGSSSQSSSSPDSSACAFSPVFSISSDDDDNSKRIKPTINDATYIISNSGESSKKTDVNHTTVYSSSSKIINSSSCSSKSRSNHSKKIVTNIEIVSSSPVESANEASEVSDFEAVTSLDVEDLVSDYGVLSPLEAEGLHNDRKLLVNKNEKTPHSQKTRPGSMLCYKTKVEDKVPCYVTPSSEQRLCPLPILTWADREAVWNSLVRKDEKASLSRDVNMFENHPSLQPRMRAILFDWLIEVCEVYKLHRETYYLTVDYIDRYLTLKHNISKNQLQLIGITCLFIASKVSKRKPCFLSNNLFFFF